MVCCAKCFPISWGGMQEGPLAAIAKFCSVTIPTLTNFFFKVFFFFLMWIICKASVEFVTLLLLFYVLVFWSVVMWDLSFPTRDRTCILYIGRQILNHWTTRGIFCPVSSNQHSIDTCRVVKGCWAISIDGACITAHDAVTSATSRAHTIVRLVRYSNDEL